jgi:hypothetical protein
MLCGRTGAVTEQVSETDNNQTAAVVENHSSKQMLLLVNFLTQDNRN